jgi:IMP dehydrogenase
MGYVGAADLAAFREKARFVRISSSSLAESHTHGVNITRESPNYPGGA